MEAKREVFKNGKPPMESPFVNQSKPSSDTPQKSVNITDSILKSKKSTPTPQPQQLPNQYSGNQASVSFSSTSESNINTGTAHVNVITGNSGEDISGDSTPIPHKALARMATFFPTFYANHTLCKVRKCIITLLTKLNKG